jgi:hypothetical protein
MKDSISELRATWNAEELLWRFAGGKGDVRGMIIAQERRDICRPLVGKVVRLKDFRFRFQLFLLHCRASASRLVLRSFSRIRILDNPTTLNQHFTLSD